MKNCLLILVIFYWGCVSNQNNLNNTENLDDNNIIVINRFLQEKINQYIAYLPVTQMQSGKNSDTIIINIQKKDSFYYIKLANESPRYYSENIIGMNNNNNIMVYFVFYGGEIEENPFIKVIRKFKYKGPIISELMIHDLPFPPPWYFYFKEDSLIKQVLPNEFNH